MRRACGRRTERGVAAERQEGGRGGPGEAAQVGRRAVGQVQPLPRNHLPEGTRAEPAGLPEVRLPFPHHGRGADRAGARRGQFSGVGRRAVADRPAGVPRHPEVPRPSEDGPGSDRPPRRDGASGTGTIDGRSVALCVFHYGFIPPGAAHVAAPGVPPHRLGGRGLGLAQFRGP